jgi:hypothetical protein
VATETNAIRQSAADARQDYATGLVTSKDGTHIGYRHIGHGPGVVVLHGTMSLAHNHMQLAEAMADAFTVYVPDRRGRGLSGPFGDAYGIQREVEDLSALLASKSPAYLNAALGALGRVMPQATRVELRGLDHAASWNSDRGGQPGLVAQELRRFFG